MFTEQVIWRQSHMVSSISTAVRLSSVVLDVTIIAIVIDVTIKLVE